MRVKVYATLRPIVGSAVVPVTTPAGAPVKVLVDELITRWPGLRPELVDGEGRLQSRIRLFINGKDIVHLDGIETIIPEGANIDIFPPVGGG